MTKKKTPTADDFLPADWFFNLAAGVQMTRVAYGAAPSAKGQADQGKAVEKKGGKGQ